MKPADLDHQYGQFPENKREDIQKFLQWIRAQPHISKDFSELEALHFYHACKGSMEMSKQVLDYNLTFRTHCTEFFGDLDYQNTGLQRAMRTVSIVPFVNPTPEGYYVILGRLEDLNASNFNFADSIKLYCMIFDHWLYEDGIKLGHRIIIDLKGVTLGHVARIGIMQVKRFLMYLQDAAPLRLVGFHFINIVPFMDKILALMTPFMKKELTSMLYLHNTFEDFYKYVPKEILPKDYGGPLGEFKTLKDLYYQKLKESRVDIIAFEKRHQVDESSRPGKPKRASDLFGTDGNFRKLDID